MAEDEVVEVSLSSPALGIAQAPAAPKGRKPRKPAARRRTRKPATPKPAAPTLGDAIGATVDAVTHEPTEQIDPEQATKLHAALLMVFGMLTLYMDEYLRPTEVELEMVLLPAERIVLRRVTLKAGTINPDLYDGLQIAIGVGSYVARVTRSRRQFPATGTGAARGAANGRPVAPVSPAGKAPDQNGWQPVDGIGSTLANMHTSLKTTPTGGINQNPGSSPGTNS